MKTNLITQEQRERIRKIINELDLILFRIEQSALENGLRLDEGECPVYDAVNSAIGGCVEALEQDNY
jgi:hypothetical protein